MPGETGSLAALALERDRDRARRAGLNCPFPVLDLATVYQQDARGQWQAQTAGDTVAVTQLARARAIPGFRLDLPPGQARDVYVRLRHTTPISLPVRLTTETAHDLRIQVEYMGLGMAFGALLLLIAACLRASLGVPRPDLRLVLGLCLQHDAGRGGLHRRGGHLLWSQRGYGPIWPQGVLALLAGGSGAAVRA
jgi:hypothetical protein